MGGLDSANLHHIRVSNVIIETQKKTRYPIKQGVIPPLLTLIENREFLRYSNCRGGTPPIAECGRTLL